MQMSSQAEVKISVIIPAYNTEQYITAALESVFSQTSAASEIIVVNDGSTDTTGEILQQYYQQDKIRLITTPNQGLGMARNTGLAAATCEYIYFFDSDDLLEPFALEFLRKKIQASDYPDMILFSGRNMIEKGFSTEFSPDYDRPIEVENISAGQLLPMLTVKRQPSASACLYITRRDLWTNNHLQFKSIISEDEEIFLRLLLITDRVCVYRERLFKRRIRPGSIMISTLTPRHAESYLEITRATIQALKDAKHYPYQARSIIKNRAVLFMKKYVRCCVATGTKPQLIALMLQAVSMRSFRALLEPLLIFVLARTAK